MALVSCCLNCGDRTIGCHGKCEKYISQKKVYDAAKEELAKRNPSRGSVSVSAKVKSHRCFKGRSHIHS